MLDANVFEHGRITCTLKVSEDFQLFLLTLLDCLIDFRLGQMARVEKARARKVLSTISTLNSRFSIVK
jgi:hypothetical protein